MKCRTTKEGFKRFQWILLALFAVCLSSCKDHEEASTTPYDSEKTVEVTDFIPKKGGARIRMIIYGSNFGTDPSLISVKVGGKDAIVVSAKGTNLYCITPELCFEGTIEVKVGEQTVMASEKYKYTPQMVVSALCGNVNDLGEGDIVTEGPFDNCGKIDTPTWFSFDPKNHKILYLSQDDGGTGKKPLRVLDLANERISTLAVTDFGIERLRNISWTPDGDMVIACQKADPTSVSNIILSRTDGFATRNRLTTSKACSGSMIHPNGELYYSMRAQGSVFRYDYKEKGYNNNNPVLTNKDEFLFNVPDAQSSFSFVSHPEGDYVYIIMHEKHYILRSNYDRDTKRLVAPYIVCGQSGQAGYEDLVGMKARLNAPQQGVFVYNKKYKDADKKDHYDFYFTDMENHCIRILTPDGVVSTFAGRGSSGVNVNKWGHINGELRKTARFNAPSALAYDQDTETFYVGDVRNHRIRKIAMEIIPESAETKEITE